MALSKPTFHVEDLQCPICMELPKTLPIYECAQGHIFCNVCLPSFIVLGCLVCRSTTYDKAPFAERKMIQLVPDFDRKESREEIRKYNIHRQFQDQLALMLHAHNCNEKSIIEQNRCQMIGCLQFKKLLWHMEKCEAGKACPDRYCKEAMPILIHWMDCKELECGMCKPLKRIWPLIRPRLNH